MYYGSEELILLELEGREAELGLMLSISEPGRRQYFPPIFCVS